MRDPFKIEGPAVISFSGGRTSGYMLRRILDAHGGGLPEDVHVLFANTGKERVETLTFGDRVGKEWGVEIHVIERAEDGSMREVGFVGASRDGEPFRALIAARNFLPNPVMRFCTQELKIRVMRDWMRARGYDHWTNVVGLRADEPGRVARQMAANDAGKERWTVVCPLFDDSVTRDDVEAFWSHSSFDLDLKSWEGNCDLCFLKGLNRKLRVVRDQPALADWWIERERELLGVSKPSAARFRNDQPSYAKMVEIVRSQPLLPFGEDDIGPPDDSLDCFCTS